MWFNRVVYGRCFVSVYFDRRLQSVLWFSGELSSMRHHKAEVDTITKGRECGLRFTDMEMKFEKGDKVVCYTINHIPQICDWYPPGF